MQHHRRRISKKNPHVRFDKYELYRKAVQSPEHDAEFVRDIYKELRGKEPRILREDFCGTFLISKAWIELNEKNQAYSVDFDPEPLEYGRHHYLKNVTSQSLRRLHLLEMDVMKPGAPLVDVTIAMNFSYFIFKTRKELKAYFTAAYKSLRPKGVFVCDLFGGSDCQDEIEEKTKLSNFIYYWDQEGFDPVTNHAVFHIHFKPKGMKKQERVFTYDWRMWTLPELRELLEECGFAKTHVYWEGTDRKGEGDGQFTRTEKGEACQAWVAYIAAER